MTNNELTRRERREQEEFIANAPWGSYYANALAFIIESLIDEGTPIHEHGSGYISEIGDDELMEWCEIYNTTIPDVQTALRDFQAAVMREEKTLEGR